MQNNAHSANKTVSSHAKYKATTRAAADKKLAMPAKPGAQLSAAERAIIKDAFKVGYNDSK